MKGKTIKLPEENIRHYGHDLGSRQRFLKQYTRSTNHVIKTMLKWASLELRMSETKDISKIIKRQTTD